MGDNLHVFWILPRNVLDPCKLQEALPRLTALYMIKFFQQRVVLTGQTNRTCESGAETGY